MGSKPEAAIAATNDVILFGVPEDEGLSDNARIELKRRERVQEVQAELDQKKRSQLAASRAAASSAEAIVDHEMGLTPCLDTTCDQHHPPTPIPFYTPAQIALIAEVDPNWIIRGMFAPGTITEIDGKVKRSGKTTLLLAAARAILDEELFLSLPTRKTKVVYLTEQQVNPFMAALTRAGLADQPGDLFILFRNDMKGYTWPEIIEAAVAKCIEAGAELLIIDTIAKLAGVRSENDTEAWYDALTPLQDAAAQHNLAIGIARHSRKSEGDVGDTGRGNSAASGEVDIIFDLRRPEGNVPTTRRILESAGRYSDTTPEKMVLDFDPNTGTYKFLGTDEGVAIEDAARFVSALLVGEFGQNETGATMKDLEAAGAEHDPPLVRITLQRGIDHLSAQGKIHKTGRGVKGDAFHFLLVEPGETRRTALSVLRANGE